MILTSTDIQMNFPSGNIIDLPLSNPLDRKNSIFYQNNLLLLTQFPYYTKANKKKRTRFLIYERIKVSTIMLFPHVLLNILLFSYLNS